MSDQTATISASELAAENREHAEAVLQLLGSEEQFEYYHEDVVMEFPYARPGMPTRVEGKAAVLTHLVKVGGDVSVDSASNLVVHETADPEVVILEFDGHGRSVRTGEPYEQRYISVIRARGGKMVHFKDYWNPIQGLKAQLGAAVVDAFILNGPAQA